MITRQEIDIIKTEIINELDINSKLIDDLTPVTSLLDDDLFEIHGGRRVSFSAIRNSIGAIEASTPDLSDYATRDWVNHQDYLKASALNGYATETWVDAQGFLKSVSWGDVSGKPTTLAGYGITDAYTKTEADGRFLGIGATAKAAEKLSVAGAYKAWGQTFFENGVPKSADGVFRELIADSLNGGVAHSILNYSTAPYGLITRIYNNGSVSLQAQRETTTSEWFDLILNPLGGKVGVKTTTPQYDLDVNGTASVSQLKIGGITLRDAGGCLEIDKTVVSLGDVQSRRLSEVAGGTGGGDFSIMSSWDAALAADPDYVLSAGLGYSLYTDKLSKAEAEGLYQPKGNYLTAHQSLANYVDLTSAQTISGVKTFSSTICIGQDDGAGKGLSLYRNANHVTCYGIFFGVTSKFAKHGAVQGDWATYFTMDGAVNRGWIFRHTSGNVASVSAEGKFTGASFIKAGGTSAQFLKADGSVDSNTYLTSHQALDYINVKDIRNTTPAPNAMADRKVTAWFNNSDNPSSAQAWYSGLTVKGWGSSYASWQLGAGADTSTTDQNLYFRTGVNASWNAWQKVLTSANYSSILDNSFVKKSGDMMTGLLSITTYGRTFSVGSRNADWCHYETDAPSGHWFNTNVSVQGEIYAGASYNQKVWHAGNDGAGSGLDADLLDGYHEGNFMRTGLGNLNDAAQFDAIRRCQTNSIYGYNGVFDEAYGTIVTFYAGNYNFGGQFYLPRFKNSHISYRGKNDTNDTWAAWNKLAFLDDTVAAASKLATARSFAVSDYDGSHTGAAVAFNGEGNATLKLPQDIDFANLKVGSALWFDKGTGNYTYLETHNDGSLALHYVEGGVYKHSVGGINPERKQLAIGSVYTTDGIMCDNGNGAIAMYAGSSDVRCRIWALGPNSQWVTEDIFVDVLRDGTSRFYNDMQVRGTVRIGDIVLRDAGGYLEINKSVLSLGDIQSKKAGPNYGEVVRIDYPLEGSTVKIPATASVVILQTSVDGGEITLEVEGDINDVEVIDIYAREFSAGDVTVKFKYPFNNNIYQYTFYSAHLALVRYGNGVWLQKYS